jgi:hypothetical protein
MGERECPNGKQSEVNPGKSRQGQKGGVKFMFKNVLITGSKVGDFL